MPKFGQFVDAAGNCFDLYGGFRDKLKPNWRSMLSNGNASSPDSNAIDSMVNEGRETAVSIKRLAEAFGIDIGGAIIVEIGCHAGSVSFALAELGAKEVIGTEFQEYKESAMPGNVDLKRPLEAALSPLEKMRDLVARHFKYPDKVEFKNDDICNSYLPSDYFNLAVSNDVLEHLHDIDSAFKSVARILKPGGIACHDYNPFFSLNGGHSLCTLDFPWGHARLNEADFVRYLKEFRPNELERAKAFYTKGLNRATIADVLEKSREAGLEILAIFRMVREQHLGLLNGEILMQSTRHFPNCTAEDLVCPRVVLVQKKPDLPLGKMAI